MAETLGRGPSIFKGAQKLLEIQGPNFLYFNTD